MGFEGDLRRRLPCTDCATAERGVLVKDRTEMVIKSLIELTCETG